MPRIRSIKPEFWDSPSTAKAGPWARLLFIAMWNWADDHGRGTANLKELEGFAFPNDDQFTDRSGNTVHFRDLVAEVSECFGVVVYTVEGRRYYEIPGWDKHQRNERRSKASKHPSPQVRDPVAEIPCKSAETGGVSGPGTGEQGNRGTVKNPPVGPPEGDAPPPKQSRRKTAKAIPSDWSPTEAHQARASELGLDVHQQADDFMNHAIANDRRQVDWDAAFRTWLSKSAEYRQQRSSRPSGPPRGQAKQDQNIANLDAWVRSKRDQQNQLPFPGGDPA